MFTPAEARVFREGDNIILRLTGLTFDSGKSQIKPESFDLLAKVEKAIDVFPRSELIIEGHTDSFGSDDANQSLSQERAESVSAVHDQCDADSDVPADRDGLRRDATGRQQRDRVRPRAESQHRYRYPAEHRSGLAIQLPPVGNYAGRNRVR